MEVQDARLLLHVLELPQDEIDYLKKQPHLNSILIKPMKVQYTINSITANQEIY